MKASSRYVKIAVNLLVAALGIVLLVLAGPKLLSFFMPLIIGWLIAAVANPIVRMLERRLKIVRKHGSVIIIVVVLGAVIGIGYLLIIKLGGQILSFLGAVPDLYEQVSNEIHLIADNLEVFYQRLPVNMQDILASVGQNIMDSLGNFVGSIGAPTMEAAGNFAKNIPGALISAIFTLLSAYFFIAEREKILVVGRRHTPEFLQEKWGLIVRNMKQVTGGYILAQLKIMAVVAVILFIGLFILGVNYSFIFAILIALLDALPFFGTGTALVPWAIFRFLAADYTTAIGLVAIYGISQLVRQLIQPKMLGDSIGLNPLAALIFMFIGYRLYGVLGMIVAVPVGVIIMNLFQAGAFDGVIENGKILLQEFNDFRRL